MDVATYNAACDVIDQMLTKLEGEETMYEELAGALGFNPPLLYRDAHPAILARARACKAAYDQVKEGRV